MGIYMDIRVHIYGKWVHHDNGKWVHSYICGICGDNIWVLFNKDMFNLPSRQTIYHIPDTLEIYGHYVQGTLQLGDPSIIANYCGITTVGDFRLADMAVKGQGAPLIPYLDCLLTRSHYAKTGRLSVFLNIGGISNIFTNGSDINNGICTSLK